MSSSIEISAKKLVILRHVYVCRNLISEVRVFLLLGTTGFLTLQTFINETYKSLLMCCWPCILMTINFRFQLNAQYFISIVMFLYMFRAHLCPSSVGPLYIYNIWFYVSLKLIYKNIKIICLCDLYFYILISDWHRTRCKYTEVLLRMGTSVPKTCRGT